MPELMISDNLESQERNEIIKGLFWIDPDLGDFRIESEGEGASKLSYNYCGNEDRQAVESRMQSVIDNVRQSRLPDDQATVYTSKFDNPAGNGTLESLTGRGLIIQSSPGVYIWRGLAAKLLKAMDKWVIRRAGDFGFDEWITPNVVSAMTLERSGYLQNFPQHVNLLSHLPENAESIRSARDTWGGGARDGKVDLSLVESSASAALSPTVCCHVFSALADSVVSEVDGLKVTSMNSCYRHEGRSTAGLHRLTEFHMRELVSLGHQSQVTQLRDQFLEFQIQFLNDFELTGTIDHASDPFFFDQVACKRIFQKNFALKQEMNLRIDAPEGSCAAGSVNFHQDYFGQNFAIATESGPAWSTCVGFGLDRMCYAFLSQYGIDPFHWKPRARDLLNQ